MSASRTVSPAEERLLDAALQQLFASSAARTATRRSPHWLLVAMLLLGLGVTATLMWQAREVQRDEAQDPQRGKQGDEVRVRSRAELDALPATTTHVRWFLVDPRELPAIQRFEGLRSLRLVPQRGTLFGLNTGYHRSWSDAPSDLLQPLAKLTKLEVLGVPSSLLTTPDIVRPLADHPTLHTVELVGMRREQVAHPKLPLAQIPRLRSLVLTVLPVDSAFLRDLAQLPLTSLELQFCRNLDADGWATLCTMRSLQRLSFTGWSWNVGPGSAQDPAHWRPTPNDLKHLHELPDLHTLELLACDPNGAQVAALPDTLTSLHLFGNYLTPADFDGLRRFGNLRELKIDTRRRSDLIASVFEDDPVPEAEAFARALGTLRVRSLHYYGALVPAVATAIGSQPDLRELTIDTKVLSPEPVAAMLANSQIETLRLRRTIASNQDPRTNLFPALVSQRGLRTLELPVDRADDLGPLAQLPNLRHLTLRFSLPEGSAAIAPSMLAPLTRCAELREVDLYVDALEGAEQPSAKALQDALGASISLRVNPSGVTQR